LKFSESTRGLRPAVMEEVEFGFMIRMDLGAAILNRKLMIVSRILFYLLISLITS
jgi:hypothetical protein